MINNKTIFAFDFSINKPAMCIYHNDKIYLHIVKSVDLEEKNNGKNI